MDNLFSLLNKNLACLDKLRARIIYCSKAINSVEVDFHKQYGPFCGYWDEWVVQAEEIRQDLVDSVSNTSVFLLELRDFSGSITDKKRKTKSDKAYINEVTSLAEGRLKEQIDLIREIDTRIMIHQQLTEKLLLVEAIDGLSEE